MRKQIPPPKNLHTKSVRPSYSNTFQEIGNLGTISSVGSPINGQIWNTSSPLRTSHLCPNDKSRPLSFVHPNRFLFFIFLSQASLLQPLSLSPSSLPAFLSPAPPAPALLLLTFTPLNVTTSLLLACEDFSIQRNPIERGHGNAEEPVQAYKNLLISCPNSNHPISHPKPLSRRWRAPEENPQTLYRKLPLQSLLSSSLDRLLAFTLLLLPQRRNTRFCKLPDSSGHLRLRCQEGLFYQKLFFNISPLQGFLGREESIAEGRFCSMVYRGWEWGSC